MVYLSGTAAKNKSQGLSKKIVRFSRLSRRLWLKYSSGRFGFSVQKQIYLEVGGKPDGKYYKEAWEKLGDRIEWRVKGNWIYYSDVTFDTSAYREHLPKINYPVVGCVTA
ncbi:GUN4 domain-containing protein [Fischerella sp. PCC 9605]|uniref:GUN4 domain-containing protein n=1 Tax=Fischerella sp. PCC 9605 TaxID=1173024 RepID=UPI0009E56F2E